MVMDAWLSYHLFGIAKTEGVSAKVYMSEDWVYKTVLVTGADGFLGQNLCIALQERADVEVIKFGRGDQWESLIDSVARADAVVHFAGENRPKDEAQFASVNHQLTSKLCSIIAREYKVGGRHIPMIFASSIQVECDNPYGQSKLAAEQSIRTLAESTGNPCSVFRLPGVFGKWSRPNYNSVVATFCHNISRDIPIQISDPTTSLRLVYVDDVIASVLCALQQVRSGLCYPEVTPEYTVTLQALAEQIRLFKDGRTSLMVEAVGQGLSRALYSTYVSFLPPDKFSYPVAQHPDARGNFVEMLKTKNSGQVSFFTANPGVTRGGHYHHTKTEKFLVIQGEALFKFRHLVTNESIHIRTSAENPEIVDTIPGWAHDITNVGGEKLIVVLWANENFDRDKPDTVHSEV